jgi:anti-anti-sigma regulatory factor
VRDLDRDALGPLITLHRRLPAVGVRFALCGLVDPVFDVIEEVGLDRLYRFEAAPATDEA